jgi:hypothetical protein
MSNFYIIAAFGATNKCKIGFSTLQFDDRFTDMVGSHAYAYPAIHPKHGLGFLTSNGFDRKYQCWKTGGDDWMKFCTGNYNWQFFRNTPIEEQLEYARKQIKKYGTKKMEDEWKVGGIRARRATSCFNRIDK